MAIHSPNTGVVDFGQVARSFGEDFRQNGGTVITGFQVAPYDLICINFNLRWSRLMVLNWLEVSVVIGYSCSCNALYYC